MPRQHVGIGVGWYWCWLVLVGSYWLVGVGDDMLFVVRMCVPWGLRHRYQHGLFKITSPHLELSRAWH